MASSCSTISLDRRARLLSRSQTRSAPPWRCGTRRRARCPTYRCLRYDARGHGRSQVLDQLITIDDLADDLAGLLDALGMAQAHIVGLSLGGMTAQAFGVRHPDRAESLTLMATAAYLPHGY